MKYYTNTDTATNETVTYKRYLSDEFARYERSLEGMRLVIPNPIIPSPAKMPSITKYTYNEETTVTTINWSDNTKTIVRAEYPETADPYTGFVTAYAKKAAGNSNKINNLFDEWAIEKPKKEAELKANNEKMKQEAMEREANRKAKRERRIIRKEALRLKREYEAKKLAQEKYGIPMELDNTNTKNFTNIEATIENTVETEKNTETIETEKKE